MACRCVGCICMVWEWIESRKYQQENINKKISTRKIRLRKIRSRKIRSRKLVEVK